MSPGSEWLLFSLLICLRSVKEYMDLSEQAPGLMAQQRMLMLTSASLYICAIDYLANPDNTQLANLSFSALRMTC